MEGRFRSCFEEWVRQQESDLKELMEAMQNRRENEARLREVVEKSMRHYEEYCEKRRALAREDGPTIFCPPWCTAFENSYLWLGGCRPSLSIRLVYAISGFQLDARIDELLRPGGSTAAFQVGLVGLSPAQLNAVNDLHRRIVKEEDKLSSKMASLQENLADDPLLPLVMDLGKRTEASASAAAGENGGTGVMDATMDEYAEKLAGMVEEADKLRVATVNKLTTEILTPLQAVELLVAAKQLHLSLHEWGQRRDVHRRQRG